MYAFGLTKDEAKNIIFMNLNGTVAFGLFSVL